MPAFSPEVIAKYEDVFRLNPDSQVFAPLADAYRSLGQLPKAENTALYGVKRHPSFHSGWYVLGKIQKDLRKHPEAIQSLRTAVQLKNDNLHAWRLLTDLFLIEKNPKEALKSAKMILLLNPLDEKAIKITTQLESLTADEYSEDAFVMVKPTAIGQVKTSEISKTTPNKNADAGLQRMLSLIDAFIVRNDLIRAKNLLSETETEFGGHPEIQKRLKSIQQAPTINSMNTLKKNADSQKLSLLNELLLKVQTRSRKLELPSEPSSG